LSLFKRYTIFIIAVVIQSCGIALVVKSLLGTSPISSFPYVLSIIFPMTLGEFTFIFNMLLVLLQLILLKKNFHRIQFLQVPMTFIFAVSIDVFMALFSFINTDIYLLKFLILLIGASFVSLGVALQGIANVLMLPGEGVVYAISRKFKFDFGKVKTFNDVTLVTLAIITSYYYLGRIEGIREGTLISALITGTIAKFFLHHLSSVDKQGNLVLHLH